MNNRENFAELKAVGSGRRIVVTGDSASSVPIW